MRLINRDTDYAIRAVCKIAAQEKGKTVTTGELTSSLKIPRPVLRKVMLLLSMSGLLVSSRGKRGGFSLRRSPAKISVMDIIRAVQGQVGLNECFFLKARCPRSKYCKFKKRLDRIEHNVLAELEAITISSII